jgi:hypothetical protein
MRTAIAMTDVTKEQAGRLNIAKHLWFIAFSDLLATR